jgi:hypothetical protein
MKLHFPNPSRSFDEKSSRILFWGKLAKLLKESESSWRSSTCLIAAQ